MGDNIAPKLRIILPRLIRLGSFPEFWRSANVTAIPKGNPSLDRKPISITPILSKTLRCMRSYFLTSSPVFVKNVVFCLMLSLLILKVWAAEFLRCRDVVLYRSARLQCGLR